MDQYLAEKTKEKENISLVVNCNEPIEKDGFIRLRRTVENLNKNIGRCSLQVLDSKGKWIDLMNREEMENIQVPLPEGLSNIQQLKRIECYASEAKERLGGIKFDLAETTRDYNLV